MFHKGSVFTGFLVLGVLGVYHFLSQDEPSAKLEDQVLYTPKSKLPSLHHELSEQLLLPEIKEKPSLNEFIDDGMRHQFLKVAEQYQQDIQFPTYSKPLKMTDWAQLNPLPFVSQFVPLSGTDGLSAEIILPHFQITRDQDLDVQVKVHGESLGISSVSISLTHASDVSQTAPKLTLKREATKEGDLLYVGQVSRSALEALQDGEILVRAFVDHEQSGISDLVATFELSSSVAELTDVGSPYVAGADMVIPLTFDVEEEGLYRVRANLFDQASGEPISHLNASFKLSSLQNQGQLKVHAATLRQAGSRGPYQLTNFSVIKAPERAGDKSAYGSTSAEQYTVSGFDLDSYSREEYQDSLNTKRLEFLNRMASHQPM